MPNLLGSTSVRIVTTREYIRHRPTHTHHQAHLHTIRNIQLIKQHQKAILCANKPKGDGSEEHAVYNDASVSKGSKRHIITPIWY